MSENVIYKKFLRNFAFREIFHKNLSYLYEGKLHQGDGLNAAAFFFAL